MGNLHSSLVYMAEDGSVNNLTSNSNLSSADHNPINNVVINLDTDEEENLGSNNGRRRQGRKRRHSGNRAAAVLVKDLCTTDNEKEKRSKNSKKESKLVTEEPAEKKAKPSLGSCPICFEDLSGRALASTVCGHVFCLECIKQAVKRKRKCPTCRVYLKGKSGYHAVYF